MMKKLCMLTFWLSLILLVAKPSRAQKPELVAQTGHTDIGGIRSVAFSSDGRLIASLGFDKTIKLWSVNEGYELRTIILTGRFYLQVPEDVTGLNFSPDGKTLVACGSYGTIWLVDVASGRELGRVSTAKEGDLASEVESVQFSPDGKTLMSVHSSVFYLWNVEDPKAIRQLRFFANDMTRSRGVLFAPGGKIFAGNSLGVIVLWDLESAVISSREARRLEGETDYDVALAFSADGKFIAGGTKAGLITVWDVATGQRIQDFKGHIGEKEMNEWALAVAFSPDGEILTSATSTGLVKVWDLKTGKEIRQSKLNSSKIDSVRFSKYGNLLAAVSGTSIKVFEVGTGNEVSTLGSHLSDLVFYASFSRDGKEIAQQGLDTTIKVLNIETGQIKILPWPEFGATYRLSEEPVSADGRRRIRLGENNKLNLFDAKTDELLGTLTFGKSNWLFTTPEGLFDGTQNSWRRLIWRFENDTFKYAPVEAFFKEFWRPGLLQDMMMGTRPARSSESLSTIDIRQPQLRVVSVDGEVVASARVPGQQVKLSRVVSNRKVEITLEVVDNANVASRDDHPLSSGARDLRLFRNGSLVKTWQGDLFDKQSGCDLVTTKPADPRRAFCKASVSFVADENRFSAYAFNHDNVKTGDAELTVTGADSLKRQGTAYILAIGVNKYSNSQYDLKYAVADAEAFSTEIKRQQESLKRYAKVGVMPLSDAQATKANITQKLAELAKQVQPEDVVIVFFAGHGTAQANQFYLIPHDLGYEGPRENLTAAGLETILSHSISDRELEKLFEGIDAGQLLLVIDACNSGQALEAEEKRRGPMNSKGLAQLAYEKGMYVMTAAQSYQAAMEASKFGHGFLTYALVEEGLKKGRADREPRNGTIDIREWLNFATDEVPRMQEQSSLEALRGRGRYVVFVGDGREVGLPRSAQTARDNIQRPRVFFRRELEANPLVVATTGAGSPR